MKKILFRADSSSIIGTGHIMRDLVLASQFKDDNIIFAVQNLQGNINHKIEEAGYIIKILSSNDIEELISLVNRCQIDMIVIDHYDINYAFEKELKEKTGIKIMVLDDTYEKHCCDILLNHNIYAKEEKYKSLVPLDCKLRCGADFTLLRDEFLEAKANKKHTDSTLINIFVAMGGVDHLNINIKILKTLASFSNIEAHIVTTTANRHLDELQTYVDNTDNTVLHINSNQIAKLMSDADFAIVTPSVVLNEIFYMDIPFVAIQTADNQHYMVEYLMQNNYHVLEEFNEKKLENLIKNTDVKLVNFSNLSYDEKVMILEWRNHPDIRKWMFSQEPIVLDSHLKYINSLSSKEDRLYFLVKQNTQPVGVIDFTNINKEISSVEFGLYAKPDLKGMGNLLMRLIIDYAFNTLKMKILISEVFEHNKSAINLYKKFNFKNSALKKNILIMELKNENR